MENVKIHELREFFDLDNHQLYKIILKASNKYGVKIINEVESTIFIDPKIFESIEVVYSLLRKNIPISQEVLLNASDLIPFENGSYVYFLVRYTEIVYIGQTINLGARIPNHFNDKKFDKIYYIDVKDSERLLIEGLCINYHNPKYNKQGLDDYLFFKWVLNTVLYNA